MSTRAVVVLRQWKDADFDSFAAMNADPRVTQYLLPMTRDQSLESLRSMRKAIEERGWGIWAVEVDGKFAGAVGLQVPRAIPHLAASTEVLWRFDVEYWGRGVAHAAAEQALDYGFTKLGLAEIIAFTVSGNTRSIRLMERLGSSRIEQAISIILMSRRAVLFGRTSFSGRPRPAGQTNDVDA